MFQSIVIGWDFDKQNRSVIGVKSFSLLVRFAAKAANLRTLLSCAHLYGWALPVPPCERIFSTIYFGIVARHGIVVLRSFPRISPKISLSRAHNPDNSGYTYSIKMEFKKGTH